MPSLRQLVPWLVLPATELFQLGHAYDFTLRVTSVRRSQQEQARLYQAYVEGRSSLPAAPPGRSAHQRGLAFDMARPGVEPLQDPLLFELGRIWLEAGGFWFAKDPVHFEVR